MKKIIWLIFVSLVLANSGCAGDSEKKTAQEEVGMATLEIKSDAFEHGETIPVKYTCDGDDVSPPLSWGQPPEGTLELVMICDDPDAPGRTWDHWIVYNLPPDTSGLPEAVAEAVPGGGIQGKNSWNRKDYGGPCPPSGPAHRYFFKLYAVDTKLNLEPGVSKAEVEKAMEGHILAKGELMGTYAR